MPLRGTVSAQEEVRHVNETGTWEYRVEVRRRPEGAWTDLTNTLGGDWSVAITTEGDAPDRPVAGFTVKLIRAADGASTAFGMSASAFNRNGANAYKPLVYPGSILRVAVANLAAGQPRETATWHPWLEGEIVRSEVGDDVSAVCTNQDGRLHRLQIETEEERGADDPGIPLQDEIQALLNKWVGPGDIPLLTVGDPDFGVGKYKTAPGSLGAFLLQTAQRIGWDLRYRWHDASNARRFTLYLPPRDKTAPDLVLSASQVYEVPGLTVDRENVRNAVSITYSDSTTKKRETVTAEDATSIAEFDRSWMGIQEGSDSGITTKAQAEALAGYAMSDLAQPPVDKRVKLPFLPFLELHHVVQIGPDGKHFDFPQVYAVVRVSHTVDAEGGAYTTAELRGGSPVGQYYAWRRRPGGEDDPLRGELLNLKRSDTPAGRLYTWENQPGMRAWATQPHLTVPENFDDAEWDRARDAALPLPEGTTSILIPWPPEGLSNIVRLFGMYTDNAGRMVEGHVYDLDAPGTAAPLQLDVEFAESNDGLSAVVVVTADDPRNVVTGVRWWLTEDGVETGPYPALLTAPKTWAYPFTMRPDHPTGVRGEALRNDGSPPKPLGPFASDTNKEPGMPDVRPSRVVDLETLLVDGRDTDTASLWYRTVTADGVLGPETAVPLRGADPRFGILDVTATDEVQRFRFYAKNAAGVAGLYRYVEVPPYEAPTTPNVMAVSASDDGEDGQVTLTPIAGGVFDTVQFAKKVGGEAFGPWVTDPAAPYTTTVSLVEKHPSAIAYRVFREGQVVQEDVVSGFDLGHVAKVESLTPADAGANAVLTATFDVDTRLGAHGAEFSDSGGLWTPLAVSLVNGERRSAFTVAKSTTTTKEVRVRGINDAGTPGPPRSIEISRYDPPPAGPAPNVVDVAAVRLPGSDCATSQFLTYRITPVFFNAGSADYGWQVQVLDVGGIPNGGWTTVEGPLPWSQATYDHVRQGYTYSAAGITPPTDVTYRVRVVRVSDLAPAAQATAPTIEQELIEPCP